VRVHLHPPRDDRSAVIGPAGGCPPRRGDHRVSRLWFQPAPALAYAWNGWLAYLRQDPSIAFCGPFG